jgi:UDP-2,4-diacetamido-2,4,6-trideoxy-beta-L-altropyranose hydrolase
MNRAIVFRVDASSLIGAGHFSRCLCLAIKLIEMNADVYFVCRNLSAAYESQLKKQGIHLIALCSDQSSISEKSTGHLTHSHWLEVSQEIDANDTIDAIKSLNREIVCLIIDHYALDQTYEKLVKKHVSKIVVIDDIADRVHECDILIDQNNTDTSRYKNLIPAGCKQLLGPYYCILRDEFIETREKFSYNPEENKNIVVSMGAADPVNATLDIVKSLSHNDYISPFLRVIVGFLNPNKEQIEWVCKKNNIQVLSNLSLISQELVQAKFVIGASGVSAWERCYLGIPSLMIAIADNQVPIAKILHEQEAAIFLGVHSDIKWDNFNKTVESICYNSKRLIEISKNAQSIVDGLGATRIACYIL